MRVSPLINVFADDKLVEAFIPPQTATDTPPNRFELEVVRIVKEHQELKAENIILRIALQKHKHTDKCFEYAANTARRHGNYYCIAECADSLRRAFTGVRLFHKNPLGRNQNAM